MKKRKDNSQLDEYLKKQELCVVRCARVRGRNVRWYLFLRFKSSVFKKFKSFFNFFFTLN
jgi:hypothetical protein